MKNSICNGNVFEWTNGTGATVVSGSVVAFEGGMIGVLVTTVADGDTGAANKNGVYSLTSGGFAGVQGQAVYWDTDAEEVVEVVNANTVYAGVLYKDCLIGDTEVPVLLNEGVGSGGGVVGVGVAVEDEDTVDGSDAATTQALANALKVKVNELLASLRDAGVIASA